jgi:hypothetical protein
MDLIFENELPYNLLNDIGIAKSAFLALPVSALDRLMTGRLSPLLRCNLKTDKNDYDFLAKILFLKKDGAVELKIFPVRKEIESEISLSAKEIKRLKNGEVVQKRINDDKRTYSFVQLDRETNNIISANINQVYIPQRINNVDLTKQQIDKLKNGEPIEVRNNDNTITVGVDLESPKGISIVNGNMDDWNRLKQDTKEIFGYLSFDNNSWEYVFYDKGNDIKENIGFSL